MILFQISYFKASTSLHQDCATLCEGDFVCLWISIFRIIKTIVGLACNVIFAGISATGFEIAAAFLKSFQLAIEIFLSSKLIVESFLERTTFVLPVGFRLDKSSFTSGCYCFKASFVSPDNYTVLFEGDMLNLRKRGSRYSQSKHFDRGRHTEKRGRSRQPYHHICRHTQLSGQLRLCERTQSPHRCYTDGCTVLLVSARGFGIAIVYAGNLATVLIGIPSWVAVPARASGTYFNVSETYGFSLVIVRALFCHHKRKRWRGSCIAFAGAVGITNAFASALGFSAVPVCDICMTTVIGEACGFVLAIPCTQSRHFIAHGIAISTSRQFAIASTRVCRQGNYPLSQCNLSQR